MEYLDLWMSWIVVKMADQFNQQTQTVWRNGVEMACWIRDLENTGSNPIAPLASKMTRAIYWTAATADTSCGSPVQNQGIGSKGEGLLKWPLSGRIVVDVGVVVVAALWKKQGYNGISLTGKTFKVGR